MSDETNYWIGGLDGRFARQHNDERGKIMTRYLIVVCAVTAVFAGCISAKTRQISAAGMYTNANSGTLVVGSADVKSVVPGEAALMVTYSEDTAWLSPSTKVRSFEVLICGTNSLMHYSSLVSRLCDAVEVADAVDSTADVDAAESTNAPPSAVDAPQ